MKHLFTLLLLLVSTILPGQCERNYKTLNNNYLTCYPYTNGETFGWGYSPYFGHLYSKQGKSLMELSIEQRIWFSSGMSYSAITNSLDNFYWQQHQNFFDGPWKRETETRLDTSCGFFNRVWIVHKSELLELQYNLQNGTLDYEKIPSDILYWPARGNPFIEEEYNIDIDFDLAPFYDFDGDSKYNPLKGDYPIVMDELSQNCVNAFSFAVYGGEIYVSNVQDYVPVEFSTMTYLLDDDEFEYPLIFYRISVQNISRSHTLPTTRIAMHENTIFKSGINYNGCDTLSDSYYIYFKDGLLNENSNRDSTVGFYFAHKCLNSKISSYHFYDYNDNDVGPSNMNMFNFWSDTYEFTDFPNIANSNSMQFSSMVPPSRKPFASFIIPELEKEEKVNIDFATVIVYDTIHRKLDVFDTYTATMHEIQKKYEEIISGNGNCPAISYCEEDCVWPGDINDDGIVDGLDFIIEGVAVNKDLGSGFERENPSDFWSGYQSQDWESEFDSINGRYLDCDGNGYITDRDFDLSILNNYHKKHDFVEPIPQVIVNNPKGIYISQLSSPSGASVILKLNYGDQSEVFRELSGLTLKMRVSSKYLDYRNATSNINGFNYKIAEIPNSQNEEIELSWVAYDNYEINTPEFLGYMSFTKKTNVPTENPDGMDTVKIKILRSKAIDKDGNIFSVPVIMDPIILSDLGSDSTSHSGNIEKVDFKIYPNPSTGLFTLDSEYRGEVEVYDMLGNIIWKGEKIESSMYFDFSNFTKGIYFVRFKSQFIKLLII
ncbi:MAG: T9SS type A sorting domain-containing protein [Saprospiraceae bacterium]